MEIYELINEECRYLKVGRLIVTMQQLNLHGLLIEIKGALGRS